MSTVLIVVLILALLVVGASIALGRRTEEVEAARDTEYLELEGAYIRYNVIGGGPPVLLVHGWLSSSRVWEALAGRLAQRFTVYTLDLEGFGESDKPLSGYGVRYGSRLLYAFCAHFGLTRTSVVGHDVGGAMAAKLAADHPDVVGRLVLVSTPADEDQIDLPTPLWLATLPVVGPLFYTLGRALRPVRQLWLRPFVADPDDLTEEVIEDAGMSTPAAVQRTLAVTRREIAGGRLARQARIIKVPMLLIAGEEDQIVDPQSVGSWARTADQAEVCLIDECGHLPMVERPAEFNAQILAFLTGDARYLDYVVEPRAEELEDEPYVAGEPEIEEIDDVATPGPRLDGDVDRGGTGTLGRLFGMGRRGDPDEPPPAPPEEEIHAEDAPETIAPEEPTIDLPLRQRRPGRDPAAEDEDSRYEGPLGRSSDEGPFESTPFAEAPEEAPRPETPREDPRFSDPAFGSDDPEEAPPGIHRRRPGGRFAREAPGGEDESANGAEERGVDGRGYEPRPEGGIVPELPHDLFKWPEAWQEYRPEGGGGSRRRRTDDGTGEDDGAPGVDDSPPEGRA